MDDQILTKFLHRTKADPSLARDLLEATEWNLEAAVAAYAGLNVTFEKRDFENESEEFVDLSVIHEDCDDLSSEQTPDGTDTILLRRRKKTKGPKPKGLTHVADEVEEIFWNMAVSETKLVIGATEKHNVFDEKFFRHSFLFPDISGESSEVQEFIAQDITEVSHKHVLEKSNRLNWWASTGKLSRLEPLGTSGDGNCLLHAASLYMWGLPDRDLILRTHLHRVLTTGLEKEGIKRRWRHVTTVRNQEAGGLVFSEDEWDFEWHEIVRIATNQPRRRPTTDSLRRYSTLRVNYESLEEIHVYAVAQVLRRPIIVIADQFLRDMNNEPLAPIYFGGIYLPLECSSTACYKSPLVLAYDSSHFSPLVAKKEPKSSDKGRMRRFASKQDNVIPLVSPDGFLLPLMFLHDPGTKTDLPEEWSRKNFAPNDIPDGIRSLLESYFEIRWIQLGIGSKFEPNKAASEGFHIPVKVPQVRFPAAVVSCGQEPEYQSLLVTKYLENARERYEVEKVKREKVAAERARQEEEYRRIQRNRPVPCVGENCDMYGTQATNNLCSRCFSRSNSIQEEKSKAETESGSEASSSPRVQSQPSDEVDGEGKWEITLPDIPSSSEQESTASVVPTDTKPDSKPQKIDSKPDSKPESTDSKSQKTDPESSSASEPKKTDTKTVSASTGPKTTCINQPAPTSTSNSTATSTSTSTVSTSGPGPTNTSTPSASGPPPSASASGPPPSASDSASKASNPNKTKQSSGPFAKLKSRFESKPKPQQPSRGYSRDMIKPLTMGQDLPAPATAASGGARTPCKSPGCEFYGSTDRDDYCSQCYSKLGK